MIFRKNRKRKLTIEVDENESLKKKLLKYWEKSSSCTDIQLSINSYGNDINAIEENITKHLETFFATGL